MVGVIDRDVLEHRRLAERHEKAQHEHRHDKGHQPHRGRKFDWAVLAQHDVMRRRIGQHEQQHQAEAEGPVHDRPRAEPVGQMPAIGPEKRGGEAEGRGRHPGGAHVDAIDLHQVVRHPQGQRHEGAKDKEVVQREPPDLQVRQRRELFGHRGRPHPARPARDQLGVVLGEEEKRDGKQRQRRRPDVRHTLPAPGHHDEGRHELGHRSADVARAKDAQRHALMGLVIPARHIGHPDDERPAGKPDAQRRDQIGRIGRGMRQRPGRGRGRQHLQRKHHPAAEPFGPDPQEQAHHRPGQDRRRDQEAELKLGQAQLVLDRHPDDRKDRPDRKAGGKGDRRQGERASLVAACDRCPLQHDTLLFRRRSSPVRASVGKV